MKTAPVYWLDRFGLTLGDLKKLGSRQVKVRADLAHVDEQRLFRLAPLERKRKIQEWYEKTASAVAAAWPTSDLTILTSSRPYAIQGGVQARDISKIARIVGVQDVWIDSVAGRKCHRDRRQNARWFTVHALFAIQIEGQQKGRQTVEDRFVAVKATSFDDAIRKLRPEFREYARPYLNPDGFMVRWHFERVVDVYDTGEESLAGDAVEVFSSLRQRGIRPEFVWRAG
jgi:hypothetical protein